MDGCNVHIASQVEIAIMKYENKNTHTNKYKQQTNNNKKRKKMRIKIKSCCIQKSGLLFNSFLIVFLAEEFKDFVKGLLVNYK